MKKLFSQLKKQSFVNFVLISISIILTLAFSSSVNAEPWPNYGRTETVSFYDQDPYAQENYTFGVRGTYTPYQDPPLEEAQNLANPLTDSRWSSYQLIIIVNKDDHSFWGRGQTLRAYLRDASLIRNLKIENQSAAGSIDAQGSSMDSQVFSAFGEDDLSYRKFSKGKSLKLEEGLLYYWLISTGMPGFETPSGFYNVQSFSSRHWSDLYDAPMLSSVFFLGGRALHSSLDTESISQLGRRFSHGCVHIEDHRAEEIFHLIGHSGYGAVDVINEKTGKPITDSQGRRIQKRAYRTLILVTPI